MAHLMHVCHGELFVRVKGQCNIGGLLTECKQCNMNMEHVVKTVHANGCTLSRQKISNSLRLFVEPEEAPFYKMIIIKNLYI